MKLKNEKLLGIDYGAKKVGLALAETETRVATPWRIISNSQDLIAKISQICQEENIDKIVIGVPLSLQGAMSKQAMTVLDFIIKIKKQLNIEVVEQDEKLTSLYAQKLLQGTGKMDDDVAAMLLLQSYLDKVS